jgi:flagellar M-ring protein FliF
MNEFLTQLVADATRIWQQMTGAQRAILLGTLAVTLTFIVFVVLWAQRPDYVVLYSKLGDQDAGAIITKLKERGVTYQLEADTIKVPSNAVHEVRLNLASAGLPSGGTVGFQELFSGNANWTATDFERRLNYQRGLEGELSRTIEAIQGVEKARVHIVIPKESLFVADEQETTASVLLTLEPLAKLEVAQVRSVQHMVAKAVPRLKQEQVFITDTAGRDYTEELAKAYPGAVGGTDLTSRQMDIKRRYERDLERRIQDMLDPVLGQDNSIVRVYTKWDFSQTETNAEIYTPSQGGANSGILLSEKSKKENYKGAMGADGGAPGNTSNADPTYMATRTGNGDYNNEETTRNFDVNKEVQRRVKEPAVLQDTSVSIVFNPPRTLNAQGIREQETNLARMVAAAAGIENVQQKVSVKALPFNNTARLAAERAASEDARWNNIVRYGTFAAALLLGLVALVLLLATFRRRRAEDAQEMDEVLPRLPADDLGITLLDEEFDLGGGSSRQSSPVSPEQARLQELQEELSSFIKSQPKDAIKLLRAWKGEDD